MSENISISDLRAIAEKNGYDHIICFATKGRKEFVATYGATIEQCDQAAQFGDKLKDGLGWPESLHALPSRVKKLLSRAEKAEAENKKLREGLSWYADDKNYAYNVPGKKAPSSVWIRNMGERARMALKGGEG